MNFFGIIQTGERDPFRLIIALNDFFDYFRQLWANFQYYIFSNTDSLVIFDKFFVLLRQKKILKSFDWKSDSGPDLRKLTRARCL